MAHNPPGRTLAHNLWCRTLAHNPSGRRLAYNPLAGHWPIIHRVRVGHWLIILPGRTLAHNPWCRTLAHNPWGRTLAHNPLVGHWPIIHRVGHWSMAYAFVVRHAGWLSQKLPITGLSVTIFDPQPDSQYSGDKRPSLQKSLFASCRVCCRFKRM